MKTSSWLARTAAIAATALMLPLAAQAAGPAMSTLEPGGFREIQQNLKVNVVFIGFSGATAINPTAFQAALPATYRAINRDADFYGLRQYTGNRFNFSYNVVQASPGYADALFSYLSSIAAPQARTLFQNAYNGQPGAAVAVGQNHWIDAPSAEAWMAKNPPPGVDTSKYTVFFINWYGRADFKFHVYTKTDTPDPDTGYNFGVLRASRKMVAWGGTPVAAGMAQRVWFYDFSAGPESWAGNYDITSPDFDGDGVPDYRIPPIWDYGNPNGYRPFNDITGDAARLTRFVAINLLFTTSPIYNAAITPPALPSTLNIDMNPFQGDPTSDARAFIKPASILAELGALQKHNTFTSDTQAYKFAGRIEQVMNCFVFGPSCFGNRLGGNNFGDLFLYTNSHIEKFLDGGGDYEVPVLQFNLPDALTSGLLGFADDDYFDGTQSYVFAFMSPSIRSAGYGFTTTTTHEVGHHLGMSHPHDGYDSELDTDYGPGGSTYFAWSGDESNTIMSYIDLSTNFSQFDRDNSDRWMTAAYINQSNVILPRILKSHRAPLTFAKLLAADADAGKALASYGAMDYRSAVAKAKAAYTKVLEAAALAKIEVEPTGWVAGDKVGKRSGKSIDHLDVLHRLAP
jgi:hypothetical protein